MPRLIVWRTLLPVMSVARELHRSARHLHQADNALSELPLPVAGHAGNTDDLARVDGDRETIDGIKPAVVLDHEILDDKDRLANGLVRGACG